MKTLLAHRAMRQIWFALALSPLCSALADDPKPKTHSLFMGADVLIQRRDKMYRVYDVEGDSLVIDLEGQKTLVPLSRGMVAMKIEDGLKLARGEVIVADLQTERAYTPGRDPRREFIRNASAGAAASDMMNAAVRRYVGAEVGSNAASSMPDTNGAKGVAMADAQRQMADASREFQSSGGAMGSDMNSAGFHAQRMYTELDKQLFDAMEITFRVSSERRLLHPYLIAIARLKEPEAKPGEFRHWIVAKALDPIGPQPENVHIFHGGLPPGYTIDSFQLHLYDHGQELPTSVSSKRVQLTRDEAFQYVVLEYLGTHKADTLAASVAMAQVTPGLRTRIERGEFPQPYYVKVSKAGLAGEVYLDPQCTRPVTDDDVAATVKTLRFKPALEKGKPVDSVTLLKLPQLPM